MAPEQAAGKPASPANDWYAVGVMLYEALSGHAPFRGSVVQVLQDKQRLAPPPLPPCDTIPQDLADLCMQLLARDPRQRPDALAMAKAIATNAQTNTAAPVRSRQLLVGREQHLAALKDAYRTVERERKPLTVFFSGRSGEGKTTLGEHFLTQLRQDKRTAVMSGRCYDRESVPFKALDSLVDALCSYLRSLPADDAALMVPDDVGMLVGVFPVLARVEVVSRAADTRPTGLDEQQVRQRAFRALRSLVSRISRRGPIVWFIDDLQWGDADSAEALFELLRPPEAPAVLLLGTYRSDEAEGSAFLKKWQELQRKNDVRFADREVKLAALTVEECIELVVNLLEKDTDSIRRRAAEFAQETGGNPFLLIELVGCFDPETDSFEPLPLHEVLSRKLARVPAEAEHLLQVVAVSGQALSLGEAVRTAGHALPPMATITRMRNERLIRLIGPENDPVVDTYHDRVREAVVGRLDEARSKTIHRTLAEVIEKDVGGVTPEIEAALESGDKASDAETRAIPRLYDLAYHFDAAGEKHKAWTYALLAAEQARRQYALEVATQQYAIARRNAVDTPDAVRYRIATGFGEALMLLGRYDEATAQLEEAASLTNVPVARATVEGYLGEIALKRGWAARSSALSETALRRLGKWVPKSRPGWAWALLREALIHFFHLLFPKRLHTQAPTRRSELTGRLCIRLAYGYLTHNSPKALWAILAGMNHAERYPPSLPLAFAYVGYGGFVCSVFHAYSRALIYINRSMELRREFNDLGGIAQSLYIHGVLLFASARFEESIAKLDESLDLYRKAGDQWEINATRLFWALCHEKLGNLPETIEVARPKFAEGVRLGDDNSCHFGLSAWSIGARGSLPFEELKSLFRALPDNIVATAMLLMAEAYWHWFHARTEEALQALERAYQMVKSSRAINWLTIGTLPCLVTALRRHADVLEAKDVRQSQSLRRRAFRLAKWATRLTRFFPPHYPHALRELSFSYAAKGRLRKALRVAEKSCAVAEGQNAKCEYAESLLLRGQLERQLGLPEADEKIRKAEGALAAFEKMIQTAIRQPMAG
jgi:tetratricopeptide (TPR) repeat protein